MNVLEIRKKSLYLPKSGQKLKHMNIVTGLVRNKIICLPVKYIGVWQITQLKSEIAHRKDFVMSIFFLFPKSLSKIQSLLALSAAPS
ncbi:MAG: hypothetical protein LBH37_02455 [Oscillospiraceae bacterium]|jgi:hypothetical protein|nr:hypothetical protein [Oscillospiraceae bacterium]